MPFIGNQPALSYTSFAKQDFTTSATTSYTLDHPVTNENEIALFINFVRQEPTTAYTATGTSLTLTSATSASDDMYCVFLGKAVQTVNPPSGSVGLSQLSATGTKDATTFLRGDNTFASAGGDNTPAFEAYLSASTTITHDTETKVQFNTEIYDTDSCYDNATNYRFTPTTAGKYFVYGNIIGFANTSSLNSSRAILKKNGTTVKYVLNDFRNNPAKTSNTMLTTVVDMNGSSDYVELYALVEHVSSGSVQVLSTSNNYSAFGAYKLIGV